MMLPLLKSDFYRLLRSAYFWVVTVLSVVFCGGFTLIGTTLAPGGDEPTPGAGHVWRTHAAMLSDALLAGGMLCLFVVLMAVYLASEDTERGFVKNLFAGRSRRTVYYVEKLTLIADITVWLTLLNIAVMEVMFAVLGYRYAVPEPWGGTVLHVALMTLGMFAMGAVAAALTWLIRSKAFAMTAGVLVAIGIVHSALALLAAMLVSSMKANWIGVLPQMTITSALQQLGGQPENLFFSLADSAPTWGWPLWVFSLVIFALWIAVAAVVTLLANRRRDVC